MSRSAAFARSLDRVARVCDDLDDGRALRLALLDEIRRVVPFDRYAWLLTDPETEIGAAPVAEVPRVDDLPRLIRLKYQTPVNRWTHLDGPVGSLRGGGRDRRRSSLLWRELLVTYGVSDVASMVFRDRFGCWSFLDLWRVDPAAPFSGEEVEFLAAIAPPVTRAVRRAQAHTFELPPPPLDRTGPVVLVLSPELDVRAQTPDTEQFLAVLLPPDSDRRPIPAAAYNAAAQLLAVESGVDDHPPVARVHLDGGVWLTLRASRIGDAGTNDRRDLAVSIEPASAAERMSLFGRAHGLSDREIEVLDQLRAGADTRHLAEELFVSRHTVQDHLKSIFAKTGTHNRRTLLARALGR